MEMFPNYWFFSQIDLPAATLCIALYTTNMASFYICKGNNLTRPLASAYLSVSKTIGNYRNYTYVNLAAATVAVKQLRKIR